MINTFPSHNLIHFNLLQLIYQLGVHFSMDNPNQINNKKKLNKKVKVNWHTLCLCFIELYLNSA